MNKSQIKEYIDGLIDKIELKYKDNYRFWVKIAIGFAILAITPVAHNTLRSIINSSKIKDLITLVKESIELSHKNHEIIQNVATIDQVDQLIKMNQFKIKLDSAARSGNIDIEAVKPLYYEYENLQKSIKEDYWGQRFRSGDNDKDAYIERLQQKYYNDKGIAELN